jgi:hypothetical protein
MRTRVAWDTVLNDLGKRKSATFPKNGNFLELSNFFGHGNYALSARGVERNFGLVLRVKSNRKWLLYY